LQGIPWLKRKFVPDGHGGQKSALSLIGGRNHRSLPRRMPSARPGALGGQDEVEVGGAAVDLVLPCGGGPVDEWTAVHLIFLVLRRAMRGGQGGGAGVGRIGRTVCPMKPTGTHRRTLPVGLPVEEGAEEGVAVPQEDGADGVEQRPPYVEPHPLPPHGVVL